MGLYAGGMWERRGLMYIYHTKHLDFIFELGTGYGGMKTTLPPLSGAEPLFGLAFRVYTTRGYSSSISRTRS